ncbi:hypothetical protein DFH11DRAFT_1742505 [Phellopilus nigrolimitatus]|nr:hypothetical protein DFH11DRAFT_1742505 [Phellopilus nigrolimitatus]
MPPFPKSEPKTPKSIGAYIVYALCAQVFSSWGILLSVFVPIFSRQPMPLRVETRASRYRLLTTRPKTKSIAKAALPVDPAALERVPSLPPVQPTRRRRAIFFALGNSGCDVEGIGTLHRSRSTPARGPRGIMARRWPSSRRTQAPPTPGSPVVPKPEPVPASQIKPSPSDSGRFPLLPSRSRPRAATFTAVPSLNAETSSGTAFKQARLALQRSLSSTDIPTISTSPSSVSATEAGSGPRTPTALLQAARNRTQTALNRTSSRIYMPVLTTAGLAKARVVGIVGEGTPSLGKEADVCGSIDSRNAPEQSRARNYRPSGLSPSIPKRPKLGSRRVSFGGRLQSQACPQLETCAE